ncbi:hypothetical protein TWF696_005705 [Orbilia brochopaga]|uniref:GYF domain-containing protein n=1 Tax=Orbilia brochopaga TaxID=3140254 RepID=A0AAV9UWV6_9PEZI
MSGPTSATSSTNAAASKDDASIGNGVPLAGAYTPVGGGTTPAGSQQAERVRRPANGVAPAAAAPTQTPASNSTSNQSGPRRPSLSTTMSHTNRAHSSAASASASGVISSSGNATPLSSTAYQSPHSIGGGKGGGMRDPSNPFKHSKAYMLDKFDQMESNGHLADPARLGPLLLGQENQEGLFGGNAWGSKERNGNGTEACWDPLGTQRPVSHEPITAEEKELFQSPNSVQKTHQTPNTPGGPNSATGPPGQANQPRNSASATNLNTSYHKSNPSVSSAGVPAPSGTASPTTRNRPRRDTAENAAFPPIGRRRLDRGSGEDSNPFDRFSGRSSQPHVSTGGGDEGRDNEESGASAGRGVFKRQASASGSAWSVSSPVTPGGGFGAFANGTFGGVGSGFVLSSGVPVPKGDNNERKFGGSIGRAAGRSLVGDKLEEENEDAEGTPAQNSKTDDAERQAAHESSLQQLSRESEAETAFDRGEYGRRPGSTDTDPFNPRESLQPGDLDVDNPLEDKLRTTHGLGQDPSSFFNDHTTSGPIGRNMVSTPTRNLGSSGVGGGAFTGSLGPLGLGSNVASPSSTRQGQHTPLSGFHSIQTQGQTGSGMSGSQGSEPLSPADTNPYQSPLPEAEDAAGDEEANSLGGFRSFRPPGGSDRSQTSSAGIIGAGLPNPGLSGPGLPGAGLPGLGALAGFNGPGGFNGPLGTPGLWSNPPITRDGVLGSVTPQTAGGMGAMGPGGSFFGPSADSTGINTPSGMTGGAFGTTRASRLGQLFPAEQQQQLQQLQQHQQEQQRQQSRSILEDDGFDPNEAFRALALSDRAKADNRNSADAIAPLRGPLGGESTFFMGDPEVQAAGQGLQMPPGHQQIQPRTSFPTLTHSNSMSSLQQLPPGASTPGGGPQPSNSSQPPSQRSSAGHIMIMPDKITWVYKDPTGKIQGPFSGLEMHDWYKAGFFQPDLLIRRQEEPDFEPLGQFIRKIGNSREPFLIPMQGPAFPPGAGWTAPNPWGQNTIDAANGIVQPPFPGAFPTFGTTLTAEQQNALERRKQEEQYLMARQREYLVQQQVIAKQVAAAQHMTRMSQESLHHHPSQTSLHSTPSVGNLQSPGAFGVPPNPAAQPGGFSELRHTTSNPSLEGFPSREDFGAQHAFPGGFGGPPSGGQQTPQTTREQAQILERQRAQMARQYQTQQQLLERQQQQRAQLIQQAIGQPQHPQQQQQIGSQGLVQGQQAGIQRDMAPYQVAAGDDAIDMTQDVGFDNDTRPDMSDTALGDEYERELFQKQHLLQIQQHEEDLRKQQQYEPGQQAQYGYFPGQDVDYASSSQGGVAPPTGNEAHATAASSSSSIIPVSGGLGPQDQQQELQLRASTYTDEASTNEPSIANDESLNNHDEEHDYEQRQFPPTSPLSATSMVHPEAPKNPWGAVPQSAMPLPFPAPKSVTSPRPSTAQSVAKSPSVGPAEVSAAPAAPWAAHLETVVHQKNPSLKEIQENQAKQVAKAEAAALEARRQEHAQQALLAAANASSAPASGLPSSSTWATSTPSAAASSATTVNANAWAKPLAKAATGPTNKKTLTQIQKEEEARKQKAIAQAALPSASSPATTPVATTARRSEWASKAAAAAAAPSPGPAATLTGGAWTTVGAGGKKIGAPAAVTSPQPQPKTILASASKGAKKPAAIATVSTVSGAATTQKTAQDEFMKWCKLNLKGLNAGVNVDDFLNMIMSFPPEVDLISDSVYQQSTTIDGRRFAEEFLRRRKLAQQGVVVDHGHHGDDNKGSANGGWNEVAKKGRETTTNSGSASGGDAGLGSGSFKVVQGKKKKR